MAGHKKHLFEEKQSACKALKGLTKQPSTVLGNLCSNALKYEASCGGEAQKPDPAKEYHANSHTENMDYAFEDERPGNFSRTLTAATLQGEGLENLVFLLIVQNVLESRNLKTLRPLPVFIGCKEVNLLKLSQNVTRMGGYSKVTAAGLWMQISGILGFEPSCGPGIKLIYVKYLKPLESEKVLEVQAKKVMTMFRPIVKSIVSKLSFYKIHGHMELDEHLTSPDGEPFDFEQQKLLNLSDRKKVARIQDLYELKRVSLHKRDFRSHYTDSRKGIGMKNLGEKKLHLLPKLSGSAKRSLTSSSHLDISFRRKKAKKSIEDKDGELKTETGGEINVDNSTTFERKTDPLMDMFIWMKRVALQPGSLRKGQGPRGSTENQFWVDECELLATSLRTLLWVRGETEMIPEDDHLFQTRRVLKPSKYYKNSIQQKGANGCHRTIRSARLAADSFFYGNDRTSDARYDRIPRKRIPIGPDFQAEVEPSFQIIADSISEIEGILVTEDSSSYEEHESKWYEFLGVQVWPLPGERSIINEERIGKGKSENCSCRDFGSLECFQLHIKQEREKLKSELGDAFFLWGFDTMGETVSVQWTSKEEETFKSLVKMNPASEGKDFWPEVPASFPSKDRKELISYYFNVFVWRRRASQNRLNLKEIDSDDDETDYFDFT